MNVTIIKNQNSKIAEWISVDWEKRSQDSYGADVILVTRNDMNKHCNGYCLLLFEVFTPKAEVSYSLTVTRNLSILKDGQVYPDSIMTRGSYKYYLYFKSCHECPMKISFNPQTNS